MIFCLKLIISHFGYENRDGATRELINSLKQPNTARIYKDLIAKLESASAPTTPLKSPEGEAKTYVFPDTNRRIGNVKPEKISMFIKNRFVISTFSNHK